MENLCADALFPEWKMWEQYAIAKKSVIFFGWVFFLISSGSPHVRPMGRTCGEPDEIELAPMGVQLHGSGTPPRRWVQRSGSTHSARHTPSRCGKAGKTAAAAPLCCYCTPASPILYIDRGLCAIHPQPLV